jgi:MFS family permease
MSAIAESGALAREGTGLSGEQKKNLFLASLGSMLEFYEFMVFGFMTVVIAKLFFPASMPIAIKTMQTLVLFQLGYLLRPVSGIVLGHLGDRIGRKKMFLFTVFAMALPTALIGVLPTYAQIGIAAPILLLLLRLIQGVAIAGEYAGASVFVAEHVAERRVRGAIGLLMGTSYFGFFMGAGIAALLSNLLDSAALESWGWRTAFILGGIFGLIAVYLRRKLDETPLFKEILARKGAARRIPIKDVFVEHWRAVLFVTGCSAYLGTMVLIVYFYLPTYLQLEYKFERAVTFNADAVGMLVLAVACAAWGRIADRIGTAAVLGLGAVGATAVIGLMFLNMDTIAANQSQLFWWYIAFSLFMGSAAAVSIFAALSFPTEVRFSGFGLSYNLGVVIPATIPPLLAWLILSQGKTVVGIVPVIGGVVGLLLAFVGTRVKQYPRVS